MTVTWKQLAPAHAPSARTLAAAGLDLNTGDNILFGGALTSGGSYVAPAETWKWSSSDWTQLAPATTPTPAAGHSFTRGDMGWDGINDKLMMVLTEIDTSAPFTDAETLRFFHWDAGNWTEIFFAFAFPGPTGGSSYQAVLSWAPDIGKLLLFVSNTTGTIYEWDGTNWAATGDFPTITGSIGPGRIAFNGGFSYDKRLGATVYYGGIEATHVGVFAYDTVLYQSGSWTNVDYTPAAPPGARFANRYSAYLGCASGVVIYGNNNSPTPSTPSHDTLILRDLGGGTYGWVDLAPPTTPTNAAYGSLMETIGGKILYFGGFAPGTGTAYDETWLLSCASRAQLIRWR